MGSRRPEAPRPSEPVWSAQSVGPAQRRASRSAVNAPCQYGGRVRAATRRRCLHEAPCGTGPCRRRLPKHPAGPGPVAGASRLPKHPAGPNPAGGASRSTLRDRSLSAAPPEAPCGTGPCRRRLPKHSAGPGPVGGAHKHAAAFRARPPRSDSGRQSAHCWTREPPAGADEPTDRCSREIRRAGAAAGGKNGRLRSDVGRGLPRPSLKLDLPSAGWPGGTQEARGAPIGRLSPRSGFKRSGRRGPHDGGQKLIVRISEAAGYIAQSVEPGDGWGASVGPV